MTAPKIDTQAPERIWLGCADSDAHHAVWFEGDEGGTEYIRADLSAAREAAAAIAMREAAAQWHKEIGWLLDEDDVPSAIRELPIPTTPAAALDRLIAERVREAVEAEREACAKVAETKWAAEESEGQNIAAEIRARGSKEGQS